MTDPCALCEDIVRRHDPDRYYATLFAPEAARAHLFALYALYRELVHAVQAAREPMILQIRLAWWRETIETARAGKPREHHVAQALAPALAAHDLPDELFERIIEARAGEGAAFAEARAAEEHAGATSGALMGLAARVLDAPADAPAREAGIAYALAGRQGGPFRNLDTAALSRAHLAAARAMTIPKAALPAFLPAALVPLYLRRSDPPIWRRQISLLHAAMRGRI